MNSYINQIFYKCNKFDTKNIHLLEKYMLMKNNFFMHDNISLQNEGVLIPAFVPDFPNGKSGGGIHLQTIPLIEPLNKKNITIPTFVPTNIPLAITSTVKPECVKNNNNIWFPSNNDSLFWSMYIGVNELKEYNLIKKGYDNIEMNEKQKILNYIKEHPIELKSVNYKISNNAIKEIMSELMINKNTSFLALYAISCYYKKNVYIVKDKSYLYFSYNKHNGEDNDKDNDNDNKNENNETVITNTIALQDVLILHMKSKDRFGIQLEPVKQENIDKIKNEYICLESFEKPMRGVSSYKVSELDSMSKKLDIENASYMKKTELYEKIWNTIKLI